MTAATKKKCECPNHTDCQNTPTGQVSIPDGTGKTKHLQMCESCQIEHTLR